MENQDKEKKTLHLQAAKDIIIQDHNEVDSALGGDERKRGYEDLLIMVQKAMGTDPIGLKEAIQLAEKGGAASKGS